MNNAVAIPLMSCIVSFIFALAAHSDEAMLALIWIFLVHIFFNHFTPGVFPLNTSIFTGKITDERYRRDHPLEYDRLMETGKAEESN